MKTLIFSVATGGGHGHAAAALKNHIQLNDPNSKIEIIDTLKYVNPIIDKVVIGSYLNTIKITPSLFGKLYYYTETGEGISAISSKFLELFSYKLLPLIEEFQPDVLIATHAFTAEMLSILRQKFKLPIPSVVILTDYAPHSFWLHPFIDAYIVSNEDMKEEMISRGILGESIYPLGIPVKPDFVKKYNKAETLEELDLNPNIPTLLIMGGSLGMGKISEIYQELSQASMEFQILVVTGSNKKLYAELIKLKNESPKKSVILGFTKDVNKYMQACDLLLTKPGGLTITEALISQIPLALFSPIPGQEEQNAEFLLKHNLAIDLGSGKNCGTLIEEILSDKNLLETMKQNCRKMAKPYSGDDICRILHSLIENKAKNKKSST